MNFKLTSQVKKGLLSSSSFFIFLFLVFLKGVREPSDLIKGQSQTTKIHQCRKKKKEFQSNRLLSDVAVSSIELKWELH